ncbi:Uma2 family endonuclease [Microcoleus sp. herbarium7]|uniref:Uma2 family endonuclease n=1 Tax=Microcoleus sp. herbarium7 TaxID=3055435 RepID=UPI002FD2CAAC
MTQAITKPQTKPVTFDDFIAWYPENSEHRYELHEGVIVEMPKPKGKHSEVAGFTSGELFLEIHRLQLPYFLPRESIVKSVDEESGYEPDVIVLDREAMLLEPRWERESIITMGSSIRLIVEVVSTNWQDDYLTKLRDYEALGIQEYWIVDYLGLGGRLHIGYPKRPTFSVYQLVDAEYEVQRFPEGSKIVSPTFAELNLTTDQVFRAYR